jgi:tyrosine aminotransferase
MIPEKNEILNERNTVPKLCKVTPMSHMAENRGEHELPALKRSRSENESDIMEEWEVIKPSLHSENTINPIRRIVDVMNIKPNPNKELIKLNIGDPTVCGILPTHPNVTQAVAEALMSGKFNGYGPAVGFPEIREALAEFVTHPEAPVTADDIVLTSGCSHGLQLAIEALANPGQNILVPRPGFPLYVTLMRPHGIQERYYNLIMEKGWEADLQQMENLIDEHTAAIVVNNPSNPCGAVFSKEHLEGILKLAARHKVPIIADEIYGSMVYNDAKFHPLATLKPKVPIVTCDGISKRYLVPGWRLGWLIVHDVDNCLSKIRVGIRQLAQKIVGPCALMQGALPSILRGTPQEFFDYTRRVLHGNADTAFQVLTGVPGLSPVQTHGAMYMMVSLDMKCFPEYKTELEFVQGLIAEESVYCLPGTAFSYPGALRIVLTNEQHHMAEACSRIAEFCNRHYKAFDLDHHRNGYNKKL